ncbi:RHS repeat-associated core domain-containing protein [Roseibacillus persicicus]|uniref:RHS repeat domain-containing protein n=1 Tax=Roseibacillus persicicus TaxID=454148 RepID=UPI00398B7B8A
MAELTHEENATVIPGSGGKLWLDPISYVPSHDLDGNLTTDARWNYKWNGENRLVEMTTNLSSGQPWMRLTFAYDWQGRRVRKKVETGSLSSPSTEEDLRFLYDGWNLIAEYDSLSVGQMSLKSSFLWGPDVSGISQGAGGVGGLVAVVSEEENYQPSYDGNGNIISWLNEAGAVVQRNDYDPFGNLISKNGSVEDLNFGFSTKYTDEETGLAYYGYRYYDPVIGRWPSRDPIGERGGVNLYGFVENSPIQKSDYLGLSSERTAVSLLLIMGPHDKRDGENNPVGAMPSAHPAFRYLDQSVLDSNHSFYRIDTKVIGAFIGQNKRSFTNQLNAMVEQWQKKNNRDCCHYFKGKVHPKPNQNSLHGKEVNNILRDSKEDLVVLAAHSGDVSDGGKGLMFRIDKPYYEDGYDPEDYNESFPPWDPKIYNGEWMGKYPLSYLLHGVAREEIKVFTCNGGRIDTRIGKIKVVPLGNPDTKNKSGELGDALQKLVFSACDACLE